jgi:putative transposase
MPAPSNFFFNSSSTWKRPAELFIRILIWIGVSSPSSISTLSIAAADIRNIFNAPDRTQAEVQLRKTIEKYAYSASRLSDWLEGNIPDGLTIFSFPEAHWRRIRIVNILERVCKEIRRRTRVACIFPNEASCLRLVSALFMEISETWETGRINLSLLRF